MTQIHSPSADYAAVRRDRDGAKMGGGVARSSVRARRLAVVACILAAAIGGCRGPEREQTQTGRSPSSSVESSASSPAGSVGAAAAPRAFDIDVIVDGDPKTLVRELAHRVSIAFEPTGVRVVALPAHPILASIDVRTGDLITQIAGIPPLSAQSAIAIGALLDSYGSLEFVLIRAGKVRRHRVRSGAQPTSAAAGESERHDQ